MSYIATNDSQKFELNITGYREISYVDLSPIKSTGLSNTDQFLNGINLTAGGTSTPTSNTSNFYCDINFNVTMSFQLPDFLSKPSPNLTLFRKANEFSAEISNLNDTLIKIFQEMECCGISDEYNKTVVPIFRYLASSKDHKTCGDTPNLPANSCGGDSNFMKDILKVVKDITKVYTAIEPLFCLISPIPGNPWLPIDFNWMAPILPYLQTFKQFVDKIMSGTLFDLIINPIKELNKSLINCTSTQTNRSIGIVNRQQDEKTSKEIIKVMKEVGDNKNDIENSKKPVSSNSGLLNNNQELQRKKELLLSKLKKDEKIKKAMKSASPFASIPTNESIEKLNLYQIRNPGQGICRCLMQLSGMEIKLPKFPKAKIRILPKTALELTNINTNDLLKFSNNDAYDITYKDIEKDLLSDSGNTKIHFDNALSTDMNFINNFKTYMDNKDKISYYDSAKIITKMNGSNISPTHHITKTEFNNAYKKLQPSIPGIQYIYTNNEKIVKKTIATFNPHLNTSFDLIHITGLSKTGNGKATIILEANRKFINKINELTTQENTFIAKANVFKSKDYENWGEYKKEATKALKKIQLQDTTFLTSNNTLKQQNLYIDIFGSYIEPDINIDIYDRRVVSRLNVYGDIKTTEIYKIAVEYISERLKLINFDGTSGEDYVKTATKAIQKAHNDLFKLMQKYNLTYNPKSIHLTSDIQNKINTFKNTSAYKTYVSEFDEFKNSVFGYSFLEKLSEFTNDMYIDSDILLMNKNNWSKNLLTVKNKMISNIPDIKVTGNELNFFHYSIKILQCESYKLTLFKLLEENVAYDFYLTEYPTIDCNCKTIVCKLIQWVMDFILYYVNMFLGWLMEMLLEWLIPKWLRALIDLIIYKLKCIMEIVYMGNSMRLIDNVYKNLLETLKNRVNNYPYKNCANSALDKAIAEIKKENATKKLDNITSTNHQAVSKTAKEQLKEHHIKIDFVDINKQPITSCSKNDFDTVNLMVTHDIGAEVQSITLSDATIAGNSTVTELVSQPGNVYTTHQIFVTELPLTKIISGKLKGTVKSYKSFATVPIKYASAQLDILDFIDDSKMRFILSDYKTADYKIFLERNKETLLVSFSILPLSNIGDPTSNLALIKKYIRSIVLFDKAPEGIIALPSIILKEDDLVKNTHYSKKNNLFSILVDCTNFFPVGRDIYGVINTKNIYKGTGIELQANIYCKGENITIDDKKTAGISKSNSFNDTIIYSNLVITPNPPVDTVDNANNIGLQNNIQVRHDTPLIFDCTKSIGTGTSANIEQLNIDLHSVWVNLGLI